LDAAQSSGNGVGDVSQRLIPAGEQSGLPTRIAAETVSSFVPMKSWLRFCNSNAR